MSVYLELRKKLTAHVENFDPDVVHVMYGGVMADQVVRIVSDRPKIVTFHGSDLLGEHLSGTVRKILASFGVWASWRAARRANRVIAVAKNLCDALPRDIERGKIHIIPNGIDLHRFKPLDRYECCNRLGWRPNIFHVLFPANSGDPVKRPRLARAAVDGLQRMGIAAEIHYLTGVSNEEVTIWLNASNVLLLTSRHEGSPTIVKEALACDVPVVSVDVGDVRERIEGVAGCYISSPDPDELAAKLFLVRNGTGRVAGRPTIQDLSLERTAMRLSALYQEAIQSSTLKKQPTPA